MKQPKISVITPSYNQAGFIEETIDSVLGQGYPNLEYIIVDGNSTDGSQTIINRYRDHLTHFISEDDAGQSDAINKGFELATGDIMCWLNSDDCLMPGALKFIAQEMDLNKPEVLFGNTVHMNQSSGQVKGSNVRGLANHLSLSLSDYIIQPSAFWTKSIWKGVGLLRTDLHYGFDWEWFARAEKSGVDFRAVDRYLSIYRIHASQKTGEGGQRRDEELAKIYSEQASDRHSKAFLNICANRKQIVKKGKKARRLRKLRWKGDINRHVWRKLKTDLTFPEYKNLARMAGAWLSD